MRAVVLFPDGSYEEIPDLLISGLNDVEDYELHTWCSYGGRYFCVDKNTNYKYWLESNDPPKALLTLVLLLEV